jgi:capsid protein
MPRQVIALTVLPLLGSCAQPVPQSSASPCSSPAPARALAIAGPARAGEVRVTAIASRNDSTVVYAIASLTPVGSETARWARRRDGVLTFAGIRPGAYRLLTGAIGYFPRRDTIQVSDAGITLTAPIDEAPADWCGGMDIYVPARK